MKTLLIASLLLATAACGPADNPGNTGGGGGGGGGGTAVGGGSGGGGATGGGAGGGTSAALASDFAALVASKNCPGFESTPEIRAQLTTVFQTGIDRGCATFVDRANTCVKPSGANGLVCVSMFGVNDVVTNLPSCQESFSVAGHCSAAVTSTRCYALSCTGSLDCSTGWSCNGKTGHCFDSSASCLGLPCRGSLDCPTGETCNSAVGVCVKS